MIPWEPVQFAFHETRHVNIARCQDVPSASSALGGAAGREISVASLWYTDVMVESVYCKSQSTWSFDVTERVVPTVASYE